MSVNRTIGLATTTFAQGRRAGRPSAIKFRAAAGADDVGDEPERQSVGPPRPLLSGFAGRSKHRPRRASRPSCNRASTERTCFPQGDDERRRAGFAVELDILRYFRQNAWEAHQRIVPMTAAPAVSDLRALSLFAGLPPSDLTALHGMLRAEEVPADKLIVSQEQPTSDACIVLSGLLKVYLDRPDDSEIVFAMLGPGEVVGELNLI